jgi:hypothetical protein
MVMVLSLFSADIALQFIAGYFVSHSNFSSLEWLDNVELNDEMQIEDILNRLLYAIQFIWTIGVLDRRARISHSTTNLDPIIARQIWIITSLSLVLQSQFVTSAKQQGFRIYTLCSMLSGSILRFLASIAEWGIEVNCVRNETEVSTMIERMLFEPKLDLMMIWGTSLGNANN